MSIEHPGDDKRCDGCDAPGQPYEYKGTVYSGLVPNRGQKLCRACCDQLAETEGVNILVIDDRPSIPPYVVNTVRDRDAVHIFLPPELRGVDGRDAGRQKRRKR